MTEIVSKIKAKSELDCKARDIVTIEDGDLDFGAALDKFVNILKGDSGCNKIRGLLRRPPRLVSHHPFPIIVLKPLPL